MNYYSEKRGSYFINPRKDLISLLPDQPNLHVLELGAGGGDTLIELKKTGKANTVVGIELFPLEGTLQNDPLIDQFIIGNVEEMDLDLKKDSFDVVLMGDVLEHLLDPWQTIKKITPYLKVGGIMMASIPNIRNRKAFKKIFINGDFGYDREGLFDKTHYRWFCKKNMIDLMTPEGFELVSSISNLEFKKGSGTRLFNRLTGRVFEEFLTVQFITISKKAK